MKNFSLPVVAVNDMLMSESIASICCYSKTSIGSAWGTQTTTVNVLNGGTIGGTASQPFIKDDVIRYFGGILPAASYHFVLQGKAYISGLGAVRYGHPDALAGDTGWFTAKTVLGFTGFNSAATNYDFQRRLESGHTVDFLSGQFKIGDSISFSKPDGASGWVDNWDGSAWITGNATLNNWRISPVNNYAICSHTTTSCPWVTSSTSTVSNLHAGSTTPHALGGQKWFNDHIAQQYAS